MIFFFAKKCFKYCGCGSNGKCNYCNSEYFIGYDLYNGGNSTKYALVNSSSLAPNTNGKSCTLSNVEIQVVKQKYFVFMKIFNSS
jgi:hypothetical protein